MNRNPIKQWSITFPQSGEVTRKGFVDTFPPFDEVYCCQEKHENGGNHLHLGIRLLKPLSKSKMLKWIKVKWPNDFKRIQVQTTRNIKQWQDYCMKEDPDVYFHSEPRHRKKRYTEADALADVNRELLEKITIEQEIKKKDQEYANAYEDCLMGEDDIEFLYGISKAQYVLEIKM